MKKKLTIYQQINRVCKLLVSTLCSMACLAGCSPKERELLWSEQSLETQVEADEQATEECNYKETLQTLDIDKGVSAEQRIFVHVCGAVKNPGVVVLESGSRARDALEAAGGFLEEANTTYVNLAAEVADGQQLFFPTEEEVDAMEAGQILQGAAQGGTMALGSADAKVNINTADESTLCTLPGIGTSRAQAIIEYRRINGTFANTQDIMKVPGIKDSAYEKIQDKITVK